MKKLSLLLAVAGVLISYQASAKDGVYAGAGLLLSKTKYHYNDPSGISVDDGGFVTKENGHGVGGGAFVGYKKSFDQVFLAPEAFYDYLNTSTNDYYHHIPPYQQDTLNLRSRYGLKANVGYDINQSFSLYANYGYANVGYANRWPSDGKSESGNRFAAIYGIGGIFNINENWSVKAEINQQRFKIPATGDAAYSKVRLNVLQTSLAYNF
ncbi:MAG: porin family protein [Proteobacteria bacterium]|nr:porin family protein [Pseudomonadota bacterium]